MGIERRIARVMDRGGNRKEDEREKEKGQRVREARERDGAISQKEYTRNCRHWVAGLEGGSQG